jgi:hypothetical protein
MDHHKKLTTEIFRLAKAGHGTAYLRVDTFAHYMNIPAHIVRKSLCDMAARRVIHLSAWDGRTHHAVSDSSKHHESASENISQFRVKLPAQI